MTEFCVAFYSKETGFQFSNWSKAKRSTIIILISSRCSNPGIVQTFAQFAATGIHRFQGKSQPIYFPNCTPKFSTLNSIIPSTSSSRFRIVSIVKEVTVLSY